jgi:hypothetical protein
MSRPQVVQRVVALAVVVAIVVAASKAVVCPERRVWEAVLLPEVRPDVVDAVAWTFNVTNRLIKRNPYWR